MACRLFAGFNRCLLRLTAPPVVAFGPGQQYLQMTSSVIERPFSQSLPSLGPPEPFISRLSVFLPIRQYRHCPRLYARLLLTVSVALSVTDSLRSLPSPLKVGDEASQQPSAGHRQGLRLTTALIASIERTAASRDLNLFSVVDRVTKLIRHRDLSSECRWNRAEALDAAAAAAAVASTQH